MSGELKPMRVRAAGADDVDFLREMTYEAAFWNSDGPRPGIEALSNPDLARYVPRPLGGDVALVAVADCQHSGEWRVGAAWYRRFPSEAPGYGFVAVDVPELAIAVVADARNRGVGTRLMRALMRRAAADGARAISLSVSFGNPAARLYRRLGFREVGQDEDSWVMYTDLPR